MKPREDGGVVDTRLNVYGVEGLKVAGESKLSIYFAYGQCHDAYSDCTDVSIAPGNVASVSFICFTIHTDSTLTHSLKNTYSIAIVIGERAAVFIGEDLGINGI